MTTTERDLAAGAERRWIDRSLMTDIEAGLERDRCALLVGPYEVGKSELAGEIARRFGEDAHILNANLDEDRAAMAGAEGLLRKSAGQLLVIDEVHGFPEGLDLIRASLEAARRRHDPPGRFLLLGSDTTRAQRMVAERLGTYAPTYRLSPIGLSDLPVPLIATETAFVFGEVAETSMIAISNEGIELERLWIRGGYPRSLLAQSDADSFSYCGRYIDNLCNRGYAHINPALAGAGIRDIVERIAVNQGEPFKVDRSKLDHKALLDHFEDLGLVRQLRPWFVNRLKRLEKNPKVYLRDSGLLHAILGRRTMADLTGDATVLGHSWEGFCIENLVEAAPTARPFFYRAEDERDEIDLILEYPGDERLAIELKSPSAKLGSGFSTATQAVGAKAAFVVRPVPESSQKEGYREMTLSDMIAVVRDYGR